MVQNISMPLRPGDTVAGHITDILPSGVLVWLDSGVVGKVRARELFWDRERVREFRKYVKRDQRLDMIVEEVAEKHVYLSVRHCERDPWTVIDREELANQPVTAEILGRTDRRAYGELDCGLEVEINLSRLRRYISENVRNPDMDYEIVIGDSVRGIVDSFDEERRLIILDVPAYLSQMQIRFQSEENLPSEEPSIHTPCIVRREIDAAVLAPSLSIRILVAENDPNVNPHLVGWFSDFGYDVEGAENLEDLRMLCNSNNERSVPFDLALIDIDFPKWEDGFEAARIVQSWFPACRICLMTAKTDFRREVPNDIHFHDILLQPVSMNELERVLSSDDPPMSWNEFVQDARAGSSVRSNVPAFAVSGLSLIHI